MNFSVIQGYWYMDAIIVTMKLNPITHHDLEFLDLETRSPRNFTIRSWMKLWIIPLSIKIVSCWFPIFPFMLRVMGLVCLGIACMLICGGSWVEVVMHLSRDVCVGDSFLDLSFVHDGRYQIHPPLHFVVDSRKNLLLQLFRGKKFSSQV